MKAPKFLAFIFALTLIVLPASLRVGAAPAAAPQDSTNLYKEIMDHKTSIQWKTAKDTSIPTDVCTMFNACASVAKVAVLTLTEGGQKIQRGLFLSPTGDKARPEALILFRQTSGDAYFFLVGPDGSLQKTAYIEVTGKSWIPMSNTLAQSTFAKDKAAWHTWVSKPAAAAKPAADAPAADAK
jgi:hypothetical protein